MQPDIDASFAAFDQALSQPAPQPTDAPAPAGCGNCHQLPGQGCRCMERPPAELLTRSDRKMLRILVVGVLVFWAAMSGLLLAACFRGLPW